MDDQGLLQRRRRLDVAHEARALPVELAAAAEIVEPGLPHRHYPLVGSQGQQPLDGRVLALGLVRMHAHGGEDVLVGVGQRPHARKILEIDGNTHKVGHLGAARLLEHVPELLGQRREVDVAVGIDQLHGPVL